MEQKRISEKGTSDYVFIKSTLTNGYVSVRSFPCSLAVLSSSSCFIIPGLSHEASSCRNT